MPTAQKTFSPSELAKLEHSFATDPSSEAYRPLAEAYLGLGRFMEAMVVCKKGVKAHPTRPEPRMLLARVYAEQGKDKKALEELVAAVQVVTGDKGLWRMTGELQMKVGERDAGKTSLLKALELDPSDGETQAAMKRHNVEAPRAAAPPPRLESVGAAPSGPPRLDPVPPGTPLHGRTASMNGMAAVPPNASARSVSTSGARAVRRPSYEELEKAEEASTRRRRQRARPLMKMSAILIAGLLIVPIIYYGYGQWRAGKVTSFKRYMKSAVDEVKHDSFASYQKATESAEKASEFSYADDAKLSANSLLGYVWALRWGEHGGGDTAREKSEEYLSVARKIGGLDSYFIAGDALFKSYSGQAATALSELTQQVESLRKERRESATLNLTLGIIRMNAGDSEGARDSLTRAQELAQSDARIYAALGNFYRRQGQDRLARDNFDAALKYERGHPESMLGIALTILERDRADYLTAARMLKELLNMTPPPSPRQLAVAHLARALLVARVSRELPQYNADGQRELIEATGVSADAGKTQAEIGREEDRGFSLDPKNPDLRLLKGKRLALEGQVDAAAQEMRAAIELDKNRAQPYVELARLLMQRAGGEKEAITSLTQALRTMGNSPKLLYLLGQAYRRQGNTAEALTQFQRAVADPKIKNPDARLAMGVIHREQKDYSRAGDVLEKAILEYLGQRGKIAETYTELGRVHEEKGERAKADETYQAALKSDPSYSPAYFHYGRFLSQDKTTVPKARQAMQEYLKLDPGGEYADEARRLAAL